MTLPLFLSLLSTQVYLHFDHYMTLRGLFSDIDDFMENYPSAMSPGECERIDRLRAFDQVWAIWDYCCKRNIQVWYPGHDLYPDIFLRLKRPPLFLSVKGSVSVECPFVSIVGSRNPSSRVLDWMDSYLPEVVKSFGVISGAARGVDQRAHQICLRAQRPTLAFLPSGLGSVYPSDFLRWHDSILAAGGALISEYAPFQTVRPLHFSERNRMIAMLGLAVLICEAGLRSGSYMTARLAIENSKTLCVLPSFPTEIKNAGGLNLIFQGAFPIRDSQDLLVLLEAERLKWLK